MVSREINEIAKVVVSRSATKVGNILRFDGFSKKFVTDLREVTEGVDAPTTLMRLGRVPDLPVLQCPVRAYDAAFGLEGTGADDFDV